MRLCSFLKSVFTVTFLLMTFFFVAAQQKESLLKEYREPVWEATIKQRITDFSLFEIEAATLKHIAKNQPDEYVLEIPFEGGLRLLLTKHELLDETFKVFAGTAEERSEIDYAKGAYYKGEIIGQANSFAAISFFEDELIGVIADGQSNINIGVVAKPGDEKGLYGLIYRESAHLSPPDFICEAENSLSEMHRQELEGEDVDFANSSVPQFCFASYLEGDFALFQDRGSSVTQATNFITGAWNVVSVLFANDQITSSISEIFIWTSPDGYATSSSNAALNDFRAAMSSGFNGDLAHLISRGPNSFGGIAYVDVLCDNQPDFKTAVSRVNGGFNQFPNYSWTVNVLAHEAGHNLGSPHTHSCFWNGNNTQIDDAGNIWLDNNGGNTESCFNSNNPILPAGGGTIMSYGHLISGFGINFNNGFGPQPGSLVRSRMSSCTDCSSAGFGCTDPNAHNFDPNATEDNGSCQTCDDGLLNGSELGVDCGGPLCAPCNCDHPDIPALVQFYNNTNGNSWNNNTGWTQGASACSPCDWFGITCQNDRVTEINLVDNGLSGPLPANIQELTQLRRLNLWINNLTGTIPTNFYQLFQLEYVDFGNSDLTGSISPAVGNLTAMEVFYVENNNLSGNIPDEFWTLSNMRITWLFGNGFSGPIDLSEGQWPDLFEIRIQANNFSGDLPEALGNLALLQEVDFEDNNFSDCFPASYQNLCNLTDISFAGNSGLPGNGDFAAFCNNETGICGGCTEFTGLLEFVETEICPGDEITLFLSLDQLGTNGPYSFTYSANDEQTIIPNVPNFGTSFEVAPTVMTTYTLLEVSDADGCLLTNLSPPTTISVLPESICNPVAGCTNPTAHNFDPAANVDDGSCETCGDDLQNGDETGVDCGGSLCIPCAIPGCTDPDAHNYNSNANQNDGSCETCDDGILNGDETGVDCGGSLCDPCIVPGCTDPDAHNYNPVATENDGSCETCSDGLQNGDETGVDCGGLLCAPCAIPGCTDSEAHNFNPEATVDDGSCETCNDGLQNGDETGVDCGGLLCAPCAIPGCTDSEAHNFNPEATVDDGNCETCSDGLQNGDETGVDCGGALCAPCAIPGCTDSEAHNFNPEATIDDGSCETCSDGLQNGDETGVDCGGLLCAPCAIPGCTDSEAHNFNPEATVDDGSCETCSDGLQNGDETGVDCGGVLCAPCAIPGCTDSEAHNFNPEATVDDGSCETCSDGLQNGDETGVDCGGSLCAPCVIPGCNDPNAHNFNPEATVDDGSCETCDDGILNGDEVEIDCGGALCGDCGCNLLANTIFPTLPDTIIACSTDEPFFFPATDANGVVGNWNFSNPINLSSYFGEYILVFTPDKDQCATNFRLYLEVSRPMEQSFEFPDTICITEAPFVLPEISTSNTPGSWTFNGEPISSLMLANYVGQNLELNFTPEEGYCATPSTFSVYVADCNPIISYDIDGQVYTQTAIPLSQVQLQVGTDTIVTDEMGYYRSTVHQQGDSVHIEPFNYLGGFSTSAGLDLLDLILVRQHILGIGETPLTPYQMLAADVNGSGHINILDLVEMLRVLLGIDDGFSHGQDWIYIDASYDLSTLTETVPSGWPEYILINPLEGDTDGRDFIAIKLGDIDDSFGN